MSEENQVHQDEHPGNVGTIEDIIAASLEQNYNKANEVFGDLMAQKMSDALEQQKIAIANQIYSGGEPEADDYEANGDDVDQQDDADFEIEDPDEDLELDDEEIDQNLEIEN